MCPGVIYVGTENKLGETSSNSSLVHYIHIHAITLGKAMEAYPSTSNVLNIII